MSQFGYCVSNQNYNDAGQMDGCGDTYQSLSSNDSCQISGMSEYQQGLMGATPSFCNQSSDYAPVRAMYQATNVPAIARLQYHAPITQLYDNTYVNPIMTVQGSQIGVKPGAPNQTIQNYQTYAVDAVAKNADAAMQQVATAVNKLEAAAKKEGFYFAQNPVIQVTAQQLAKKLQNLSGM